MAKSFIGIDLGTTFSAIGTLDDTGRPKIVHNRAGANITPSVISFMDDGRAEVGEEARRSLYIDPHTIGRFKRHMGTDKTYDARGRSFTPTELSQYVLTKLKNDAEAALGELGQAVVTIPANFSHEARDATMQAARNAGLDVRHIINEPTAAALYYAYTSGNEMGGNYAVYDLGGGTFDISIIRISGQDVEVLATNGVAELGGDDFDRLMMELVQKKFKDQTGEDLEPEDFTKNDAEMEKKSLSRREKVTLRVARKIIEVTRAEFNEAISSLVTQTEMLCEATVDEAELEMSDIQGIFLVGGSTRVPVVSASVERVFGKAPESSANVDEVVALGAGLYAMYKAASTGSATAADVTPGQRDAINKMKLAESTSKCFGTMTLTADPVKGGHVLQNTVLIRKGAKIPCSVTQSFYTVSANQTEVDCEVTESTSAETDPRFVKVVWKGSLELPEDRDAGQEIKVTYAYDSNQIMQCSFVDVATGRETHVKLSETGGDVTNSPMPSGPPTGAPAPQRGGIDIEEFTID